MHYLIDGYNLMFRLLGNSSKGILEQDRQQIIKDIYKKTFLLNLEVTLVFDSQYREGESTRSNFGKLEIHFTNQGETADEYLLGLLKDSFNLSTMVLVTSDKQLSHLAKRAGIKTESIEEFIALINRQYNNKLKQKTLKKKKLAPPTSLKPTHQQLPNNIPEKEKSVDECFEYYLMQFEQLISESFGNDESLLLVEQSSSDALSKILKKKKKKKNKERKTQKTFLTEAACFEYYLKEFEKKLEEDQSD